MWNVFRSVSILDLACGTGLLGGEVIKHGYVNLDGLDASLQMLNQARKKNIFKLVIFKSTFNYRNSFTNHLTYLHTFFYVRCTIKYVFCYYV